jgi:hypothetical protein
MVICIAERSILYAPHDHACPYRLPSLRHVVGRIDNQVGILQFPFELHWTLLLCWAPTIAIICSFVHFAIMLLSRFKRSR